MNSRDRKLQELGFPLDQHTPEGALVEALVIEGSTIYASGQVPFEGDQLKSVGKVPSQVSVEEATAAAALCAANVLRAVRIALGLFFEKTPGFAGGLAEFDNSIDKKRSPSREPLKAYREEDLTC